MRIGQRAFRIYESQPSHRECSQLRLQRDTARQRVCAVRTNLATKAAGAVTKTLPTQLLNTTVTVNGELAPLFYVDALQIDAQMPWDIPGNAVASVIVTNGTSVSNAAAVYVPANGYPGNQRIFQ